MSIMSLLLNRSKINAASKKTARARKREGEVADKLFQEAYQGFAEVVSSDPVIADALYHWGFALFHQAMTKTGDEMEALFDDAIEKFAFSMTVNPHHLGAAIDWGATLMEQARVKPDGQRPGIYAQAQQRFVAANAIQAGTASYNLACIAAIQGDDTACLVALQDARSHGSLPSIGAILNDSDLASVQHCAWFSEFVTELQESAAAPESQQASATAAEAVKADDVAETDGEAEQPSETGQLPEADMDSQRIEQEANVHSADVPEPSSMEHPAPDEPVAQAAPSVQPAAPKAPFFPPSSEEAPAPPAVADVDTGNKSDAESGGGTS